MLEGPQGSESIAARTILWAAGVHGGPLSKALVETFGVESDRSGRIVVSPDFSIPNHPEVFVVGDLAVHRSEEGSALPGMAPAAMQAGSYVARVIQARLTGEATPKFRYRDLGSMATIGRAAAVADIKGWKTSGLLAWLIWLFVHLMNIVEFQNRLLVFTQWAWNYITFNRSARLITEVPDQDAPPPVRVIS
jgi:NADH dehydrogenase